MIGPARRLARPRGFDYTPRYFNPESAERRKKRIRFTAPSQKRLRKTRQPAFVAVGLGLVLALYLYLQMDTIAERVTAFGAFFFGG
jgi:hypothetical protein